MRNQIVASRRAPNRSTQMFRRHEAINITPLWGAQKTIFYPRLRLRLKSWNGVFWQIQLKRS